MVFLKSYSISALLVWNYLITVMEMDALFLALRFIDNPIVIMLL